jgi:hypothetical protein
MIGQGSVVNSSSFVLANQNAPDVRPPDIVLQALMVCSSCLFSCTIRNFFLIIFIFS